MLDTSTDTGDATTSMSRPTVALADRQVSAHR
jgi:hypothetical protein